MQSVMRMYNVRYASCDVSFASYVCSLSYRIVSTHYGICAGNYTLRSINFWLPLYHHFSIALVVPEQVSFPQHGAPRIGKRCSRNRSTHFQKRPQTHHSCLVIDEGSLLCRIWQLPCVGVHYSMVVRVRKWFDF